MIISVLAKTISIIIPKKIKFEAMEGHGITMIISGKHAKHLAIIIEQLHKEKITKSNANANANRQMKVNENKYHVILVSKSGKMTIWCVFSPL